MMALVLYALISTALWYLGSRAMVTHAIWSRYSSNVAKFMDCPACSGFWYGLFLASTIGRQQNIAFMGIDALEPTTPFLVGVCMITVVPVCAGIMQWGFWQAGEVLTSGEDSLDQAD